MTDATDNTGASPDAVPARVYLEDALNDPDGCGSTARMFLDLLGKMIKPLDSERPESDFYALEAALQHGFEPIDGDAELYAAAAVDVIDFAIMVRSVGRADVAKVTDELAQLRAEHERLVQKLDVALNGAVGAGSQPSLSDLVAQVERQRRVQVFNLPDGMRINFQAPDGARATLHINRMLDRGEIDVENPQIVTTMRAAIATYPVAGVSEPEMQFGLLVSDLTPEQRARVVTVYDNFDAPFDSHPADVAAVHKAMQTYILTGEVRP